MADSPQTGWLTDGTSAASAQIQEHCWREQAREQERHGEGERQRRKPEYEAAVLSTSYPV